MFAPLAILSVLYLNWLSASRFAIGYAPLVALLAADGIALAGRRAAPFVAAVAIVVMMTAALPALRDLRTSDSPPVAAAAYVRELHPPLLYVDSRMAAHAAVLLPGLQKRAVDATAIPVELLADAAGVLYAEGTTGAAASRNFVRPAKQLASMVRPRYFDATVVPIADVATLRGPTLLLPPLPGDGQLTVRFTAPGPVVIRFNGREIGSAPAGPASRWFRLLSRSRAVNELSIEPSARIESFGWLPAF
jgi:hypothetical protein